MARGISLHIGLNEVDPAVYGGKLELSGCVNDANDLSKIAEKQGYETSVLLNDQATAANIIERISENAQNLQNGDIFLLTYSGHGSSIPDTASDEADGRDESWVLYDRQFLDDELHCLWLNFKEGVRVFVMSDSCNSGTMLKIVMLNHRLTRSKTTTTTACKNFDRQVLEVAQKEAGPKKAVKLMPAVMSEKNFNGNQDRYREIQHLLRGVSSKDPVASIVLISGCQDDEFSYDYGTNGLFTSKVKETWARGTFGGTHNQFHGEIAEKVSASQSDQHPNFMTLGKNLDIFAQNKPFIINAPGWPVSISSGTGTGSGTETEGGTGTGTTPGMDMPTQTPSVVLPTSWNINDGVPEFEIVRGSNAYYYVDVVNNEQLFDYGYWNENGNDRNSYFTWNDSAVSNRLTADRFTMPSEVWNRLKETELLYVRIGTTSSSDDFGWDNHEVSASAMSGSHAPFMHVIGTTSGGGVSSQPGPATPGSAHTSSSEENELSDSVGYQGENKYNDVLLVQSKLNRIPISEGGPTTPLVEDGAYGSKTRNAITRFQRQQNLNASGKIEPGDSTFILMNLKSGSEVGV
ncbi:MAG: caspase family protein [Pricia sp.]